MKEEIDLDKERSGKSKRPWGLVFIGLVLIGAMVAMPFIAGEPDEGKMPDLIHFLGRFHPVVLHLPIGIFSLVMLQEMWGIVSRKYPGAGLLAVFAGVVSAVVAVLLGFLLYQGGTYDPENDLVKDHLWGGIIFACAAVVTFIAKWWSVSRGTSKAPYILLLFSTMGVMGYASHDGASITHGPTYLTEYAPNPVRELMGLEPKKVKEPVVLKPLAERVVYADIIQPIFDRRCVECHKADKAKGKLRMDTFEWVMEGGKEGSGIDPGEALDSNIIFRAELPVDDEEHMPPEGKKDILDHELLIVKWWIDEGADPEVIMSDLEAPEEVLAAIAKMDEDVSLDTAAVSPEEEEIDGLRGDVMRLVEIFPGALSYDAVTGGEIVFDGVKLRKSLDDKAFAQLEPVIGEVVSMDLSATAVTDKSMTLLAKAEKLRVLRLAETGVTDASLDGLVKLESLESVNLYGTTVTDAGVKKLAALPNLKRLYLWQTEVSDSAIAELKKALPELEIIEGV
ncbi:MAG: c-type cytochrome domain-containing protein [Luteolibacter sp.]